MNHSELIGSFIRKSGQPLEANFIFQTIEELIQFYNKNPEEKGNLHKGLLKIVENDGHNNQVLYWVQSNDKDELEFTPLISGSDITKINDSIEELRGAIDFTEFPDGLEDLLKLAKSVEQVIADAEQIKKELKATVGTDKDNIIEHITSLPVPYNSVTKIANTLNKFFRDIDESNENVNTWVELVNFLNGYKDTDRLKTIIDKIYNAIDLAYNTILGSPIPSEEFRTLRKVEDFTRENLQELRFKVKNLQTEINNTQIGVGLEASGAYRPDQDTKYLKGTVSVMHALKVLDSMIGEAINHTNLTPIKTKSVDIQVKNLKEGTEISADVLLDQEGDIIERDSGLYYNVRFEVESGNLIQYVNGVKRDSISLGLSSTLEDVVYDNDTEHIIITMKLNTGETKEVKLPVHDIIEEWEVKNDNPDDTVTLTKTRNIKGKDQLSADVRISQLKDNQLEKRGNALYVAAPEFGEKELQDILDRLTFLTGYLQRLESALENLKEEVDEKFKEVHEEIERIEKIIEQLREDFEAFKVLVQKEITRIDAKIDKAIEDLNTRIDEEVKTLNDRIDEVIKDINNTISELETKLTDLINQVKEDLETSLDDLKVELEQSIEDLDTKLTESINNVIKDLTELTNQFNSFKEEVELLKNDFEKRIKALEDLTKAHTDKLSSHDKLIAENKEKIEKLESIINESSYWWGF